MLEKLKLNLRDFYMSSHSKKSKHAFVISINSIKADSINISIESTNNPVDVCEKPMDDQKKRKQKPT